MRSNSDLVYQSPEVNRTNTCPRGFCLSNDRRRGLFTLRSSNELSIVKASVWKYLKGTFCAGPESRTRSPAWMGGCVGGGAGLNSPEKPLMIGTSGKWLDFLGEVVAASVLVLQTELHDLSP